MRAGRERPLTAWFVLTAATYSPGVRRLTKLRSVLRQLDDDLLSEPQDEKREQSVEQDPWSRSKLFLSMGLASSSGKSRRFSLIVVLLLFALNVAVLLGYLNVW
jgi:hypothetical protein